MFRILTLLLLCGLAAVAVRAQDIVIPLPVIDHHVHGLIGSLDTSFLTVIDKTNQVHVIRVPANFKMPTGIQPGKYVRATYYIDNQNQSQLVRIHLTKSQTPSGDSPVNSVPGL